MAALNTLIRKASSILKLGGQDSPQKIGLDGEAIFCKNNVCVHPPTTLRTEVVHYPGYLSIKEQTDEVLGSTLILTWIPNTILKKNPRSLENRTPGSSPCRSAHSSSCPSPNISSISPLHLPYSGVASPFAYVERSVEDFSQLCSKSHQSDRRSISSTISDMGSPREDAGSLDSFSTSDHTEMTASTSSQHLSLEISDIDRGDCSSVNIAASQVEEKSQDASAANSNSNFQSQSDSGIGPEEVIAALEMMISGLNDMDSSSTAKTDAKTDEMSCCVPDSKCNENEASKEIPGDVSTASPKECLQNHSVDQVCQSNNPSNSDSGDNQVVNVELGDSVNCCNTNADVGNQSAIKTEESNETEDNKEVPNYKCLETVGSLSNLDKDQERKGALKLNLVQNFNGEMEGNSGVTIVTPEVNIDSYCSHGSNSSSTTPTTSNRDPQSLPSTPGETPPPSPLHNLKNDFLFVEGTPESLAHAHNLIFPDAIGQNQNTFPKRGNSCGVFSVDLSQMRSLRLFFSNKECTCGQLVIASRESQYKILHFHYGGLDRLAKVFEEYNFLSKSKRKLSESCPYHQFSVCRPEITAAECHPEEGIYAVVDEHRWCEFINEDGVIDDEVQLRKEIFFGGLDPKLRKEAWPFLLHHYSFQSTFDEREQIRNDKYIEYQAIRRKREQMTLEEQEAFWKKVQCTVEKDVVRTDRSNPFFAGNDNPHIEIMKNILLNYAVYNPAMGYTQGMSDLLAPVLAEIQDEAETFWCFVGLMQRTIFVSSPKDTDMDTNLNYLRELFRLMTPKFYGHLQHFQSSDSLELLFVHRWILLCFKREFPEQEALRMWESCWAHYQTDYFHLFLCLAIVAIYGDDVIAQDLRLDEMLVHFSSLAMHMNGELVLRKARGLLHQFRLFPSIPCTLSKLCELCGPGMWDSGYVPVIKCTGNHWDNSCPYGGLDPSTKVI